MPIAHSQDIHFSNYHYAPLQLSPAKTGAFLGTYRTGANVRDQYNSFIENSYQTATAYADMPVAYGLKDHHWIGVGLDVFTDKAGDLALRNSGAHLGFAYHLAVDPKYKTIFTFGFQFGLTQRSIDRSNFRSETSLANNFNDPDLDLLEDFNPTLSDVNIGVSLKNWTSKRSYIDLGVALYHLTQSSYTFSGSSVQNSIANRINAYGEYFYQTSPKLNYRTTVIYSNTSQFTNLIGQFNLEYKNNKKSNTILKGGLGYRVGDAMQILAGLIYKGWDVGLTYDLTVSSAAEFNNNIGGIELGVKKVFIKNKKPEVKAKELCPRL
jgi:type IX secretion system PorP/SprF family membrane protein